MMIGKLAVPLLGGAEGGDGQASFESCGLELDGGPLSDCCGDLVPIIFSRTSKEFLESFAVDQKSIVDADMAVGCLVEATYGRSRRRQWLPIDGQESGRVELNHGVLKRYFYLWYTGVVQVTVDKGSGQRRQTN
jgi:hypothetical protein